MTSIILKICKQKRGVAVCIDSISRFYFSLIDVKNWQNTDIFHCFLANKRENGDLRKRLINTIMTGFSRALLKILPLVSAKTSQARSLL